MSVPIRKDQETIANKAEYKLIWWAGIEGGGSYMLLEEAVRRVTGVNYAPIGTNVIALSLYKGDTRVWTGLYSQNIDIEKRIKDHADELINDLIMMDNKGNLPVDQYNRLLD